MKNLNTISNFSQSWQRATQFLEPVPRQDGSSSPARNDTGVGAEDRFATGNEETQPFARSDYGSHIPNYGAIRCGAEHRRRYSDLGGLFRPILNSDEDAAGYVRVIEENLKPERDRSGVAPLGKSTVPMTIFNCANILVGVGILALPLGLQQCGWVVGLFLLTLPALVTAYTAKLLVRCQARDPRAVTYGDISDLAFGRIGRNLVEVLFVFELITANVALIILFADSVSSLIPTLTVSMWKVIIAVGLVPLNFVPLRILSVSSAIGIFCIFGILVILITTGLVKPDTPGSLLQMAHTRAFPVDWRAVPATLGLFVAPWGGHSIIPSVFKDMRHPQRYGTALAYTYGITYSLALSIAALGYLMFGDGVLTEITSNILSIRSYPRVIAVLTLALVAVVPLTKIALVNRPLMDTINRKLGVGFLPEDDSSKRDKQKNAMGPFLRVCIGTMCNLLELSLAIAIPNFDDVVALMGSALCIVICIILPACFYLKICRDEHKGMSVFDQVACWSLIVIGTVCAICGTLFAVIDGSQTI